MEPPIIKARSLGRPFSRHDSIQAGLDVLEGLNVPLKYITGLHQSRLLLIDSAYATQKRKAETSEFPFKFLFITNICSVPPEHNAVLHLSCNIRSYFIQCPIRRPTF
jgi:hypothetical protein